MLSVRGQRGLRPTAIATIMGENARHGVAVRHFQRQATVFASPIPHSLQSFGDTFGVLGLP